MTAARLQVSGFLSMVSAILSIPWFLVVYFVDDKSAVATRSTEGVLLVLGTLLLVYLFSTLRMVLTYRYRFRKTDKAISLLIVGNIALALIGMVGIAVPSLEYAVAMTTFVFVIPLGIIQIRFGRMLLDLPNDLNGLRKPYAYLNMTTGFCQAIFFLMPVALFTGAVADVMLGTLFFSEARMMIRPRNRGRKT